MADGATHLPGPETLTRRRFTYDEVERMQEVGVLDPDEKFELIDGEIVPMAAQNMPHMLWKSRLAKWFYARLPNDLVLVPEGTLRLKDAPAATAFETDLLLFRKVKGATAIRADMVALAIEVADTSRLRDLEVKAPRYGAHGVQELWVVDIPNRLTRIFREPGAEGYARVVDIAFDAPLSPLFAPDWSVTLAALEAAD